MSRESQLVDAFVELADTLVIGFDIVDFLHVLTRRSVQLLDVDAAGLLLTDSRDQLHFAAASTEQARLLELLQLQNEEGPCLDAYQRCEQVASADLRHDLERWPYFAEEAVAQGFLSVQALPLRLRGRTVGALNLLRTEPGKLSETGLAVGQGLADVATIGILNSRVSEEKERLAVQLQTALNSRIILEQAKGVLSERRDVDMDVAFALLRGFARDHNRKLSEVARAVVRRDSDVAALVSPSSAPAPRAPKP